MTDILLCSMPCGHIETPSLGLSLLKACLGGLPYTIKVRYFSLLFAQQISYSAYSGITDQDRSFSSSLEVCDWLFAEAVFDLPPEVSRDFIEKILQAPDPALRRFLSPQPDTVIELFLAVRRQVEPFLDACLEEVAHDVPRLAGFTCLFDQRLASLALAKRIKARYPETFIVFGGQDCQRSWGVEIIRQFPFVDAVVSGPGEIVFPEICRRVMEGIPISGLTGVYTQAEASLLPKQGHYPLAPAPASLDHEPYPDVADYFEQLTSSGVPLPIAPYLALETSRGCWWHQKEPCAYCSFNKSWPSFTAKSGPRALAELEYFGTKYPGLDIFLVDNIVSKDYFKTLFPTMKQREWKPHWLYIQIPATLSKTQLRLLRDAGVTNVQPGIESLSTEVLHLMHKGSTLLHNVQILKWAREFGLDVGWNILYGLPGESAEAYARMAEIIPLLAHLQPPGRIGMFLLHPFSPLYEQAEEFGLRNIQPLPVYAYIYPFAPDVVTRLARNFIFSYAVSQPVEEYTRPLHVAVLQWQKVYPHSSLWMTDDGESLAIRDRRPAVMEEWVLFKGLQRLLYLACDRARSLSSLKKLVEEQTQEETSRQEIEQLLQPMLEKNLMLREGQRFLSLATLQQ